MGEIDTSLLINSIFSKIGFEITIERNVQNFGLDLFATKLINGKNYNIGFEIKPSLKREYIINGIKTLSFANRKESFDKLVLISSDKNLNNITDSKLIKSFLRNNPFDLEILNIFELNNWSKKLIQNLEPEEENKILFIFRQAYRKIINEIAKNPKQLQNLDWFNIEKVIAEIFESFGFDVTLTPPSKDGGKDIILECYQNESKKTFIVEIKHWKSGKKIGQKIAKEFLKVVLNEKRNCGLILSSSGFTNNLFEFITEIDRTKISFGTDSKIISLFNAYERVQEGLLLPINNYEKFLFDETI